ncbi:hypothetical protein [Streptomyces malaysiensis]
MTPWNFPLCQAAIKLAPALAAGERGGAQAPGADLAVGRAPGRARP